MKGHHVVKVDGYFRSNWIKVRISWTDIFQISLVRIEKKRRSLLFATNYISKRLNLELQTHFSVVGIESHLTSQGQLSLQGTFDVGTDVKVL